MTSAGGAALLFARDPAKVEVLNDSHGELFGCRLIANHLDEFVRQFRWTLAGADLPEMNVVSGIITRVDWVAGGNGPCSSRDPEAQMRTIPLSEVTAGMVTGSGAIYVTDGVFIEVVRRDMHLAPMCAANTPAKLAPEPLYVLVDALVRESFLAVQGRLRSLGFRGGFEAVPDGLA